jgi:Arc/MetJ family transcription regulator
MRTTLTIDDDVAAELAKLRRKGDLTLKELVNDVLRRGLRQLGERPKKHRPFRTRTFDVGEPLIGNFDNIADVLARLEGENFK